MSDFLMILGMAAVIFWLSITIIAFLVWMNRLPEPKPPNFENRQKQTTADTQNLALAGYSEREPFPYHRTCICRICGGEWPRKKKGQ